MNALHSSSPNLGKNPFPAAQSLTYRLSLREDSPIMTVKGLPQELVLNLDLLKNQNHNIFPAQPILVNRLTFRKFGVEVGGNKLVSALVGTGTISFPDHPHIEAHTISHPGSISLGEKDLLLIQSIRVNPDKKGIQFVVDGIASKVSSGFNVGQQGYTTDHRLSRFDTLWNNTGLVVALTILFWIFPTMMGVIRLLRGKNI